MKNTVATFLAMKQKGEKISMLTCYDYSTARLEEEAGINGILVGASLGNVMLGLPDTISVTMEDMITFGGSPRASISLAKAARAYAFIKHRGYVIPEDVRAVAHDVLRHRVGLSYEAEASNVTSEEIVSRIINKVEVP